MLLIKVIEVLSHLENYSTVFERNFIEKCIILTKIHEQDILKYYY